MFGSVNVTISNYKEGIISDTSVWVSPCSFPLGPSLVLINTQGNPYPRVSSFLAVADHGRRRTGTSGGGGGARPPSSPSSCPSRPRCIPAVPRCSSSVPSSPSPASSIRKLRSPPDETDATRNTTKPSCTSPAGRRHRLAIGSAPPREARK